MRINFKAGALAALAFASLAGAAHAESTVTLTLGGLHTGDYIDNFYNGGFGSTTNTGTSLTVGPGPNLGFTFSPNANVQAAGHSSSTGNGKFENNPSGQSEILYFASTTGQSIMDFSAGFDSLSFNYSFSGNSTANNGETVSIWSGLDGTGTLLDTLTLNAAGQTTACTAPLDAYCSWSAVTGSGFTGAESAVFAPNSQTLSTEFDGLQVTTPVAPVPLPAAGWLLLSGLAGIGAATRRRQKAA
jgi:hypothetical protein